VTGTQLKQRLAVILAADVAGYSRLMAADERATVAALDAARAVFRTQIESNQCCCASRIDHRARIALTT
jgi:adenylate cyclase